MECLILDPVGGIAGDMFLGTLLDLGVPADVVSAGLLSLGLPDWKLVVAAAERRHVGCTHVRFDIPAERGHRHLPEILERIESSTLSVCARTTASRAFRVLAEAEARVHRIGIDEVHFHEVGAADAILDVCGVALALDHLGLLEAGDDVSSGGRVFVTPLPAGSGTVLCDHGELPVPVPAVVELCAGHFELVAGRGSGEMVTPTGAALLRAVALPLPAGLAYTPSRVGYGGGTRGASLVRGVLAEISPTASAGSDEIVVLATNVDDVTAETLAFAVERLMQAGALDVSATPTLMKKGRPGAIVEVMARLEDEARLAAELLAHTGSLGVRHARMRRTVASRTIREVRTPWGQVRVKVGEGPSPSIGPEFEDCAAIARDQGLTLREVQAAAVAAYRAEVEHD